MPPKKRASFSRNSSQLREFRELERVRISIARAANDCESSDIRRSQQCARASVNRANETAAAKRIRLSSKRQRASTSRAVENAEETEARLASVRQRAAASRADNNNDAAQARLAAKRLRASTSRAVESIDATQARQLYARQRATSIRVTTSTGLKFAAFNYDASLKYNEYSSVKIGGMTHACVACGALKWKKETKGVCCRDGKVKLPILSAPPEPLSSLLHQKHFVENIRKYNASFQMTSFGADYIERDLHMFGKFKVQGQVYHQIGSLLPPSDQQHKFLQIYFIGDTVQQAKQRQNNSTGLNIDVLMTLQNMLHVHNPYVKLFKTAIENMPSDEFKVVIRADHVPQGQHDGRYNVPTTNEVAIVIVGNEFAKRDIVIQKRVHDVDNSSLKRIADTHRSYDPLQYPLLFPFGEDGYNFETIHGHKVSCLQFYAYRLMKRTTDANHLLRCGALFHQFVVDMYAKIESERLRYFSLNQTKLRVEEYAHLRDAIASDHGGDSIGRLTILPSSFTGGPRYMHERTQDAMTYVRNFGTPDLFITFTCNPKWPEILAELYPGQTSNDRTDLEARVFRQKLIALMSILTKGQIFGEARCHMYSVEWQKRGLPHAHILLWLKTKIRPNQIDCCISAELPNKILDPVLFNIVSKNMLHGPCGQFNRKSTCMKNGVCTKRFPRQFIADTQTGNDGYPLYRRRHPEQGGLTVRRGDFEFDNRWIVPYSPFLSKTFDAHINVEYCNSVKAIKYICKYVNKGSDQAVFELRRGNVNENDEVQQYQMGRYISSNEAIWKILEFPVHERYPTVTHLAVHLENGQRVFFNDGNAEERAQTPPSTTLTAFFELTQHDDFSKTLLYCELPRYYTWQANKSWKRRSRGVAVLHHPGIVSDDALGRVYTVHPKNSECYYLRLLLHTVRGPSSFLQLRTVNNHVCATFHEACQKLGLLENDDCWNATLAEAATIRSAVMLRKLFAIIITTCSPSNPRLLWDSHKESMSEDFLCTARRISRNLDMQFSDAVFNKALIVIEDMVVCIVGKKLQQLQVNMPVPNRDQGDRTSREVLRETNYDAHQLEHFVEETVPQMSNDQTVALQMITSMADSGLGGIIFLDAPGGTGKTFLINIILAKYRSKDIVALAVASSGIAATLLPGGRTAHSAFKLPLNLHQDTPVCNISKQSGTAQVLQMCKLIVWDECTMAHKAALEALNRTLQDLRSNDRPMGGVTLVLSGDFRQTLPIIPRGTAADEINACLKQSVLWPVVQKVTLSTNQRVRLHGDAAAGNFAQTLLTIGDGRHAVDAEGFMPISADLATTVDTPESLLTNIFPDIAQVHQNTSNEEWLQWLADRAILAPLNADVTQINEDILDKLPGTAQVYKSVDTVLEERLSVLYPTEFLNSIQPPGLPPHNLFLKVGAPIMLLRNLDPPRLCNGTRLCVMKLLPHVIEARIMTGCAKMEDVFIPRIPLIPTDVPYEFKRLQFPVRLAFAMTINKSQGQSLKIAGINLQNQCFSHGQLYVACSRVGSCKSLFISAPEHKIKNIVYQQALI